MLPLSYEKFASLCDGLSESYCGNALYAKCLYAQALHESNYFKSQLSAQDNNLYGMKPSAKRQKFWSYKVTYKTDDGLEIFAGYDDDTGYQSILDRNDWDVHNKILPPNSPSDIVRYFTEVKAKGYATDPNYIKKVLTIVNNYQQLPPIYGIENTGGEGESGENDGFRFPKFFYLTLGVFVLWIFRKRIPFVKRYF